MNDFRKDFLKWQVGKEKELKGIYSRLADECSLILNRFADKEGKISPTSLKTINKHIGELNAKYHNKFKSWLNNVLRRSAIYGVDASILRIRTKQRPKGAKVVVSKEQKDKIADKVLDFCQTFAIELVPEAIKEASVYAISHKLSDRVWEISQETEKEIERLVAMGLISGDSCAAVSRDIRHYLIQPETLRGKIKAAIHPGRGVYKSAYKNAMRLTRTEMILAYQQGQIEYGKSRDWIKGYIWHRTSSMVECPECDALDGQYFEKSAVPLPSHPQCMCWLEEVIELGTT